MNNLNFTQLFVNVGTAYINALNNLEENRPQDVKCILDILDCINPISDYHFGVYIEEPSPNDSVCHACAQSWFHCYLGKEEPIMRRPYKSPKWRDNDYKSVLYLRFTFEIFDYLAIEPSAMGAWQAYLLCIAKTLLPFSGILYYTKRRLILTPGQLQEIKPFGRFRQIPELVKIEKDISPFVLIDGNHAIVSCCYWKDWGGLKREYASMTFDNDKVRIEEFREETLFKYDCGIKF